MDPWRIIKTALVFFTLVFFLACAPKTGAPETERQIPGAPQPSASGPAGHGAPEKQETAADTFDTPPGDPAIRYVSASDGLVLRAGPSVSVPRKAVLPRFTRLTVISRGNATELVREIRNG
jgi:hypothetical protein